jgi:hypothetical protein
VNSPIKFSLITSYPLSFANYVVISKLHRNTFELDSLDTGDGGDGAIDGLAVIVNGRLVTTMELLL